MPARWRIISAASEVKQYFLGDILARVVRAIEANDQTFACNPDYDSRDVMKSFGF